MAKSPPLECPACGALYPAGYFKTDGARPVCRCGCLKLVEVKRDAVAGREGRRG
jgi:hypothetical protein